MRTMRVDPVSGGQKVTELESSRRIKPYPCPSTCCELSRQVSSAVIKNNVDGSGETEPKQFRATFRLKML